MPHWKNAQDYDFTRALSREQWAWEFLRRNPGYRQDYAWFIHAWQALEADYGKPPNRDFSRWKQDPRAYRSTGEIVDCEPGHACATDDEDALIECWMGQKWGFYKFPLDPDNDHPQPGIELLWRVPEQEYRVLDASEIHAYLDNDERVAMGFDLTLPLGEQMDQARRLLAILQRQLHKQHPEKIRSVRGLAEIWRTQLRILDGLAQGAGRKEIEDTLSMEGVELNTELIREAQQLMQSEYRSLLQIPEK